eukprot:344623_1
MSSKSVLMIDELLNIFDKSLLSEQNFASSNNNNKGNKTSQYLLIRILGNDLQGLHGKQQTIENVKFTLKYETNFKDTLKLYVLNKIYDNKKKTKKK